MLLDNELLLFDRIEKIKQINDQYDLESNSYLSFSGGKDSTVLHYLLDMALPGNKIPRLFINTGIEYNYIVDFVSNMAKSDDRIIILKSNVNINSMLQQKGYPFKSKEHSKKLSLFQNGSTSFWVKNYIDINNVSRFKCPKILRYQFSNSYTLKVSDNCCSELKKKPAHVWSVENKKSIFMVGVRMAEGGQRANAHSCLVFKGSSLFEFKPLNPLSDDWINWFVKTYSIQLCNLYYPPFNFNRTGCKGCPFSLNLQVQLDIMQSLLPIEKLQCEKIWKPVYDEYRRLGYRLRKNGVYRQLSIYDFLEV